MCWAKAIHLGTLNWRKRVKQKVQAIDLLEARGVWQSGYSGTLDYQLLQTVCLPQYMLYGAQWHTQ